MSQRRKRIETKECDFEWHAILRVPKSKVAALEEIIDDQIYEAEEEMIAEKSPIKPGESLLGINFEKNLRHGQFRIKDDIVEFCVQDLPCIVETYKTHNNVDLFKIADVSQILICNENENSSPMETNEIECLNVALLPPTVPTLPPLPPLPSLPTVPHLPTVPSVSTVPPPLPPLSSNEQKELASVRETRLKLNRFPHGLTPPMKNVTKCRFRKTKKTKYIDAPQIEQQLRGIFRRDMEANKIEFQLIDDEENRLDTEEVPILPIVLNANPFRRAIKQQPQPN